MGRATDKDPLEQTVRRMGDASWLILRVLHPHQGRHGIEIIRQAESLLEAADYPYKHFDPSTLHYALKRMQDDGLVACTGEQMVEVPGPHGTTRQDLRPVYVITGLGLRAIQHRQRLDAAVQRAAWTPQGASST